MKNGIFSCIQLVVALMSFAGSLSAQEYFDKDKYQRCSVISMMIEHPMYMFNDEIAKAFRELPVQDRFNDHNLGVSVVRFASQEYTDQTELIYSFIDHVHLGNRAVAKWFCYDKQTGSFSMDLIKERGFYNANLFDRELAEATLRKNSILRDAGEKLISNTYLIMNDICFDGKYSARENEQHSGIFEKKRFKVKIVSYIFQLEWNDDDLYTFYSDYYSGVDDFVNMKQQYRFVFRAKVESDYQETTSFTSQAILIKKTIARCLDINFAKLQKAYPDFQIKAVLRTTDPLTADIGVKEGVVDSDLYEVLEKQEDERGVVTFKRVGTVKPVNGKIWDNRYMAAEEQLKNADIGFTTFKKVSGGDFHAGMFLREVNK